VTTYYLELYKATFDGVSKKEKEKEEVSNIAITNLIQRYKNVLKIKKMFLENGFTVITNTEFVHSEQGSDPESSLFEAINIIWFI
jgi:5-methylcytosine-specific restriction endonuclease McrBC regulatory subunit McrC